MTLPANAGSSYSSRPHPFDRPWLPQLLSVLTFTWVKPMLRIGRQQQLEDNDLFPLPHSEEANRCITALGLAWQRESTRSNGSLVKALLKTFWYDYLWVLILYSLETATRTLQAVLIGLIVKAIQDGESAKHGFVLAISLSVSNFCQVLLHQMSFYLSGRVSYMLRLSAIGLLQRKALSITIQSQADLTVGHLVNLASVDVERFMNAFPFLPYLLISPTHLAVTLYLLWGVVGPFSLCGATLYILFGPYHIVSSHVFARIRDATASITDRRIKIVNQVLSGMRVIKFQTWEAPFQKLLTSIRKSEVVKILSANRMRSWYLAIFFSSTTVVSFLTLMPYYLEGNTLDAHTVFLTIALFTSCRFTVALKIPLATHGLSELRVACRRIERVLRFGDDGFTLAMVQPRHHPNVLNRGVVEIPRGAIDCTNLTCTWSSSVPPVLRDLSIAIMPGALVGVIGPVGSGKSTLLYAILSELIPSSGSVKLGGSSTLSYAAQSPHIHSDTVRNNIIFGATYDEQRYNQVLWVCGIDADLKQFPHGDETQIGERGVTLSGGQKARVSLARALYRRADVYLLDDPLSAVDAKVGAHIFSNAIIKFCEQATRILVTHQVHHLVDADVVIAFDNDGSVIDIGTLRDLTNRHPRILEMAGVHGLGDEAPVVDDDLNNTAIDEVEDSDNAQKELSVGGGKHSLAPAEERQAGVVTWQTYSTFITEMGSQCFLVMMSIVILAPQCFMIGVDAYLAAWVEDMKDEAKPRSKSNDERLAVYGALVAGTLIFSLVRADVVTKGVVRASRNLHDRMLAAVLHAPIRFFDTQPVGRILNRFSKDLAYLDDLLPWTAVDFFQLVINMLGAVVLACIVNPWILIAVLPLLIYLIWLRNYYLFSAREIKRIEAVNRSPVYGFFSACLEGSVVIRAFETRDAAARHMEKLIDKHSRAFHMFMVASRWLGFRLDFVCFIFLTATAFAAIGLRDTIDPGLVGLSLILALRTVGNFQWGVRQSAEIENTMTSAERILDYTKLEPEDKSGSQSTMPIGADLAFTTSTDALISQNERFVMGEQAQSNRIHGIGSVIFDQVSMKYDSGLPFVLKDVSFTLQPGEHCGIVGRTGAGKSSLLAALFRVSGHMRGRILVSGNDMASLTLHNARRLVSIIPQDPTLFSGSLRYNLDPFNEHDDTALWSACEKVQLKDAIAAGGLDFELREHGSNLSVGQRQLVCLARALLRQANVLVMDEATANVDNETDALIQDTIRSTFAGRTVIIVAHRLHSVMHCNKILVMKNGSVAEFGAPCPLLDDCHSELSQLVDSLAPAAASKLRSLARDMAARHPRARRLSSSFV